MVVRQPVAKPYTRTKFQSNWISISRDMAKYVIFQTEVPHFKKEGKMERKQNGSFGRKRQPVAQATGTSELENEKKG